MVVAPGEQSLVQAVAWDAPRQDAASVPPAARRRSCGPRCPSDAAFRSATTAEIAPALRDALEREMLLNAKFIIKWAGSSRA